MIMLDIETLGTQPGCMITQIAACRFNATDITAEVSWNIDITTWGHGFHIDAATLVWAINKGVPIIRPNSVTAFAAIESLAAWISGQTVSANTMEIWANSPAFDCDILALAMRKFDITCPWRYWQLRDVRTELRKQPRRRGADVSHDALQDCRDQIRDLYAKWAMDAR
jgi:hypothetical protein